MLHPRSSHTATLLPDGRVLIVGGWAREGTASLSEAELFDPATGRFSPAGTLAGGAFLLPDGRVLLVGGGNGPRNLTADVEIFNPVAGSRTAGPAIPQPRHAAASLVLPNGDMLITGGQDGPPGRSAYIPTPKSSKLVGESAVPGSEIGSVAGPGPPLRRWCTAQWRCRVAYRDIVQY